MSVMPDDSFYLCQAEPLSRGVPSCASCCGVYNYRGHSRELITEILEMQTALVESWDGTDEDIDRIAEQAVRQRPAARFEVIYNCPFAGFWDAERTRVGCLLHPLHLGQDLREHCRYGRRTCAEARCTAYSYLSAEEGRAVMASCRDWYHYGLCITDIDLVKDFFELCEMRLLGPVDPGRVSREPELARAFGDYLDLKESWPYATDPGRFGKYYFVEKNYRIYIIDYLKLGVRAPAHNDILLSLGSVLETSQQLLDAVSLIDEKVDAFISAYSMKKAAGDGRN